MSATRPATEFSIGIMPRSASPELIAASASSKVGQGSGSASGQAATMAIWEFAPGSPWNAIFMFVVMAPCISRSGFCQYLASGFKISGRIDAARHRVHDRDVDPHTRLDRPELLELFPQLQRGRGQRHKALQRRAAIGIKADVMVARPVAPGGCGTGKVKRAQPLRAQGR